MRTFLLMFVGLWLSVSSHAAERPASLRDIWASLGSTQNQCPELHDYFPNGGIRIFYCHIMDLMDYAQLRDLAGIPIYLQGPHTDERLNLNARFEFGHYNPEFVRWLIKNALPAAQDPEFLRLTQNAYQQYLRLSAQTYYIVYRDLRANPEYLQEQQEKYQVLMKTRSLPAFYGEDYYYFSGLYEKGYDGNVAQRAVLFWLRRFIDGSAEEFFAGLMQLMQLYDKDFELRYECELSQITSLHCAETLYSTVDAELNTVYTALKNKLDKQQRKKLLAAQRKWLAFRDSNATFIADFYRRITDEKIAMIEAKTALTRERTEALRALSMDIQP